MRTQIASSSFRGGTRYTPFAFTEQGVAMLASVLNSSKAIQINIQIVRAFVFLRQYSLNHKELNEKLQDVEQKFDKKFKDIYVAFNYLIQKKEQEIKSKDLKQIGFKK